MEKENLSQTFIQKYDALSDTFIVVEKANATHIEEKRRKFEPFSFFRFRGREQKTMQSEEDVRQPAPPQQTPPPPIPQPQPPMPPRPPEPPRPQPIPPANTPVVLSRDAYNKLRTLNSLYQTLSISDPDNSELYNSLANETLILQNTMLSIYQLLAGNNSVPNQNQVMPTLNGNRCNDWLATQNYIQSIIDDVLALQRSVNIANVDRQLSIITATLLSQKSRISTLQMSCGANHG